MLYNSIIILELYCLLYYTVTNIIQMTFNYDFKLHKSIHRYIHIIFL